MKKTILFGSILLFTTYSGKAQNTISGYIVSLETAQTIANATIILNNQYNLPLEDPQRVRSDSSGFYRIDGVKAGSYIINAWTTYRAMNQRFGMVVQSDIIEIDRSRNIDFVFSENAFKRALHLKFHPSDVFVKSQRTSDSVAILATRPQLYIDFKREPISASFIQNLGDVPE